MTLVSVNLVDCVKMRIADTYFHHEIDCIEVVFFKKFQIPSIDRGIKFVGFSFPIIQCLFIKSFL